MKRKITALLLITAFILSINITASAETGLYDACGYLKTTVTEPEFSSVGGEWSIIAQLRSGNTAFNDEYITNYISKVTQYVNENEHNGILNDRASTDNSRLILALSASGRDASNFNGVDLVSPLTDINFVSSQGVNADAYALIALDCKNYLPNSDIRKKLISDILKNELVSGGWNLDPKRGADADITAMVLTALAPYYEKDDVRKSVDKALDTLSDIQLDNGGFMSWGTENCESCATVIIALSALGIDSKTDPRFVKSDGNVYEAMMSFETGNGAFKHVRSKRANLMASEQASIALCAYERFINKTTSLYDYSDIIIITFCQSIVNIIKTISTFFDFLSKLTA